MDDDESALARRLGLALKQHRKRREFTQAELAEAAELTVNYVGYLERGERLPSVPMLARLAQCLSVTVGDLMDEKIADTWPDEAYALLMSLPKESRRAAMLMLKGLAKEGRPDRGRRTPSSSQPSRPPVDGRTNEESDITNQRLPEQDVDL